MILGNVEFPRELIKAIQEGRLVIFAGAGISIGPPANLPNFKQLASEINRRSQKGFSRDQNESDDFFLDRLDKAKAKVHTLAVQILQEKNPQPARLHQDLLRVYPEPQHIKIVTTNFDLLFEEAAKTLSYQPFKTYQAPALPPGECSEG